MNNSDIINEAFDNGINDDNKKDVSNAVSETISSLDQGELRVAENKDGKWTVNEWSKKAILLSFRLNQNKAIDTGYTKFYDKVDSKFLHTSEFPSLGPSAHAVSHYKFERRGNHH